MTTRPGGGRAGRSGRRAGRDHRPAGDGGRRSGYGGAARAAGSARAATATLLLTAARAGCGGASPTAGTDGATAARPADPGASVRWSRRLDGPVVPGPVLAPGRLLLAATNAGTLLGPDGVLYIGSEDARLYAIDTHAGPSRSP